VELPTFELILSVVINRIVYFEFLFKALLQTTCGARVRIRKRFEVWPKLNIESYGWKVSVKLTTSYTSIFDPNGKIEFSMAGICFVYLVSRDLTPHFFSTQTTMSPKKKILKGHINKIALLTCIDSKSLCLLAFMMSFNIKNENLFEMFEFKARFHACHKMMTIIIKKVAVRK